DMLAIPALGGFITDVDVLVQAAHTYTGDLEIEVRHVESDTTVRLADNICLGVDDVDAIFDQDAAAAPDCVAPIAIEGDVLPLQSLDPYTGIPDGASTWELSILDTANGDGGTLAQWCVLLEAGAADPNTCGDGVATFGEACDGADLAGESCAAQGFDGGTLTCLDGCGGFDTSGCSICGDGVAGPEEECDGADLGGGTCIDAGYAAGGTLGCSATCTFDTASCDASEGVCGNDVVESDGIAPDEECDTNTLGGTRCEDLGFAGGSLDCGFPTCGFDTSECSNSVIAMCATPGLTLDDVTFDLSST